MQVAPQRHIAAGQPDNVDQALLCQQDFRTRPVRGVVVNHAAIGTDTSLETLERENNTTAEDTNTSDKTQDTGKGNGETATPQHRKHRLNDGISRCADEAKHRNDRRPKHWNTATPKHRDAKATEHLNTKFRTHSEISAHRHDLETDATATKSSITRTLI